MRARKYWEGQRSARYTTRFLCSRQVVDTVFVAHKKMLVQHGHMLRSPREMNFCPGFGRGTKATKWTVTNWLETRSQIQHNRNC